MAHGRQGRDHPQLHYRILAVQDQTILGCRTFLDWEPPELESPCRRGYPCYTPSQHSPGVPQRTSVSQPIFSSTSCSLVDSLFSFSLLSQVQDITRHKWYDCSKEHHTCYHGAPNSTYH